MIDTVMAAKDRPDDLHLLDVGAGSGFLTVAMVELVHDILVSWNDPLLYDTVLNYD
jgi:16S rRNA A1518/A1519 N6-dimethyltransferase RsmA/KsgA/DIM1 with predicted DNA glycosylase/AP lyase activity